MSAICPQCSGPAYYDTELCHACLMGYPNTFKCQQCYVQVITNDGYNNCDCGDKVLLCRDHHECYMCHIEKEKETEKENEKQALLIKLSKFENAKKEKIDAEAKMHEAKNKYEEAINAFKEKEKVFNSEMQTLYMNTLNGKSEEDFALLQSVILKLVKEGSEEDVSTMMDAYTKALNTNKTDSEEETYI